MGEIPASEIRSAREARGWGQGELARALGVGQQTVSRWERGVTSPRGELLDRLRAALGIGGTETPPRRPLLEELPFNRLDAYQFEQFCAALAARLYPDAREVQRCGVRGDPQHGIDIRVVTADGERVGIQCKRYLKFHPDSFRNAVRKLDPVLAGVDRCVLFLSTRASAAVQKICDGLDEWTIWDSEVLSREVARLPREQTLTLLDRYFPDMRQEFLGVRTPSVWQTTEEAFRPLPGTHDFRLVGRTETLEALRAFAGGGGEPRVAVLTGAAGQGKSRLLYELALRHDREQRATTRVLPPGPLSPEEFELLPTIDHLLVIVEDAHDRADDLAMVVNGVLRVRPRARMVVATRPYGRPVVQRALRAAHLDERDVPGWELPPLRLEEAEALVREVMGEGADHSARVVAQLAADSPLLMVNAAIAMRRGDLDLRRLQSHPNVRRLLLDVFVQSALSGSEQPDDDRALLHAVAALQPVAVDVPHFQEALAGLLQMPFTRVSPRLLRLTDSRVLVRRGASVRISPDLLGDVLLAEAAINPENGSPTGYLRHVQEQADGEALSNALINTSRVEWQWRAGRSRQSVLAPLWAGLEADFQQGGADTRVALFRLLRKVAPFQPQRVLGLIRWALAHPTTDNEGSDESGWLKPRSQADVIREVPRVLEAVAVDLDHLRTVYDLLWSLGREDKRALGQKPDSPLRILLDLAAYAPGKPLDYQEILLEALPDWLEEAAPDPADRMPLALLDPLFSNTAETRTMDGWTLALRRYAVDAEAVAPVRRRAASILLNQYAAEDEVRATVAAATLREVLRHQGEDFEPYNVELLTELATRVDEARPSPFTSLETRRSLSWSAKHGTTPVRRLAQTIIDALPATAAHQLALLLHTAVYEDALVPRAENAEVAEGVLSYWAALRHAAVEELRTRPADQAAALLVSLVETGREVLADHSEGVRALLKEATREAPDLFPALLDELADAQEGTVRVMLPPVLAASFETNALRAVETCRRIIADGSSVEAWSVTKALQEWVSQTSAGTADVLDVTRALSEHSDPVVRAGALNVAVAMLRTARDAALALLTSDPLIEAGPLPDRFWSAFTTDGLLSWNDLTNTQRTVLLDQLVARPTLSSHVVQQFFAHLAEADADAAVELLRARVERLEGSQVDEFFHPLPSKWTVPLPFSASPELSSLTRSVRDWLAQPRQDSWCRELHAPELFWTLVGSADERVLGLLLEPYRNGDTALGEAAVPLLRKLPKHIVWDRVDFVAALLKSASRLSERLLRRTRESLWAAIFAGVRTGTPGKPHEEDIEIRRRARQIRDGLPRGSAVDLLYKTLEDSAQWNIDRAADDLPGPPV
ncbi:helix-turn-helix domain-containing protein [Streptomyces alkaliterrae]|uniref:Helix-turn-helix domain-containing protein n=1 Tax=Streptomyces alkaliterrae TaxID=2213162 RepID=A0A5P0YWE7_9ACTN|nr:helix-turn-helix domain-containing protein [Streptomyces alkaliterrae]MBB1261521.1 helix-turn-helix domain-containing protein [Streptomyces alkaliterrae]MQS04604.1 helix-turn-helix domain-containing protein [Streptomyces alkaliterrae]